MNVYGLIGFPLSHSFSKKYFTEKFEKENIKGCRFELFPLENISSFSQLLSKEKNIRGLAVTIPYKELIIPHLTLTDDISQKTGAVNCIQISNKILKGYNTDTIGFERTIMPLLQSHHRKALVLGNGGASRAVQYVLLKIGIEFLVVTRREISQHGFISYDRIDKKIIQEYPIIINCTPAGMSPDENTAPLIPYQYLNKFNLLYDLIYTPAETVFLKHGLEKAAAIKNGYEMLVIQAEENWRIWNEI